MINKLIAGIVSLILLLTTILFDSQLIEDLSLIDGKYSVYVNNIFYGNINDRDKFEKYIEDTYKKYNKESTFGEVYYPENYTISSVSSSFDNKKTEDQIYEEFKRDVEFLVDGYRVNIVKDPNDTTEFQGKQHFSSSTEGGEVTLVSGTNYAVVYSTNKEEVDGALDKILSTFVGDKAIDRIARGEEVDDLEVGLEEVVSYNVGGHIVGTEEKVPYSEVLVGEALYDKMLFYNVVEYNTYIVGQGETLDEIASKNSLNVNELVAANDSIISADTILSAGQEIVVNLVDPVITVESTKISVVEEDVPYETEIVEDSTKLTTDKSVVKQEGQNGKVVRVYEIDYINGQTTSGGKIINESMKSEPVKRVVVKGTKKAPSYSGSYAGNGGVSGYTKSSGTVDGSPVDWGRPTTGGYLSSPFGYRWGSLHQGIDVAGMPTGSTIMSVLDGTVMYVGYQGARGNMVIVDHGNGYVTYYQHLSSFDVSAGQSVLKGQRLGGMGNTGYSFGVHLHFEVYVNGAVVDPATINTWI